MHTNPLLMHAPDTALLLDAAAYTLDANIVIRGSKQRDAHAVVARHRGDVRSMADEAMERVPAGLPEEVYEMVELECASLHTLAHQTGRARAMSANRNERALGLSGFPAQTRGDLNLARGGRINGLVWEGASLLGVSCPFVIQHSGTSATRGFWLDNLSGLPASDWLRHRAEHLNCLSEFRGGPWSGYVLDDEQLSMLAVDYASVMCDYHAFRFAIKDRATFRFRFDWRGESVHSYDLLAERYRIADIKRGIEHHTM